MAILLSGFCLGGAALAAMVSRRFDRHVVAFEVLASLLLVAGLAIIGWFLDLHF